MKSYVEDLFPDQVWLCEVLSFFFIIKIKMYTILISLLQIEDVIMVEDLKTWQTLIGQHDSLVWKLERSKVSNLGNM